MGGQMVVMVVRMKVIVMNFGGWWVGGDDGGNGGMVVKAVGVLAVMAVVMAVVDGGGTGTVDQERFECACRGSWPPCNTLYPPLATPANVLQKNMEKKRAGERGREKRGEEKIDYLIEVCPHFIAIT
jgi:hypothetical protein